MVIHQLVVISFNKILPRLKANAVESANLRASWFVLYLLSTSCVLTLAYSTLFPLGGTLLLLSSCWHEGVHSELPGVRGLLGVRLPVDVPVVPSFVESLRICFTLPHTLYQTIVINVINNIRTRFIISFYVICAVIYCSFCCIYVWLDPGTYIIARFMSFYKPGVTCTHLQSEVGWISTLSWVRL